MPFHAPTLRTRPADTTPTMLPYSGSDTRTGVGGAAAGARAAWLARSSASWMLDSVAGAGDRRREEADGPGMVMVGTGT